MSELNVYRCSPRQAKKFIEEDILPAGLVPMVSSSPGMGKSAFIRQIAINYGLKLIDHRLSTSTPEDLQGLPRFKTIYDDNNEPIGEVATFVPFDVFPIATRKIPTGYTGWMLFLDEFNSGKKDVQAAAYKVTLDKMVGQERLHPNVAIVCAGNLTTDRAIVNSLSTAMQSRLVHIELELNFNEFMEDVAYAFNWDERIISYLHYSKADLHDFRPDHNEKTFCCPRTWDFMNSLIKDKPVLDEKTTLYAGTITSGVAVKFVQFTKVYTKIPSLRDILSDPLNANVPFEPDLLYATIMHLVQEVTEDIFEPVADYVNRMRPDFRILFFRSLKIRKPQLKSHPAFAKSMLELSRFLNDD